ncbi:unnamed protein product [Triticum turgidum subsp. durum]|uniref:Translation initiation factor 5A C-terminal domain-containing protein n=1 Tax=Triticum turgidum subsp. durum TaxID=4567 RepID=A0A9R1R7C0_TRITD|nr:unnamed protein product [Triticum turgidum subsp. durum]
MSDTDEHHFESKADSGASKTYPQQAGAIRKGGHIVIKARPLRSPPPRLGSMVTQSVTLLPLTSLMERSLRISFLHPTTVTVPHVDRQDYQLIDITDDGYVSLLTESGNTKDDLKLPTDDVLLGQIKTGFADGKDLILSVMSAMGEEQICAVKEIGGGK